MQTSYKGLNLIIAMQTCKKLMEEISYNELLLLETLGRCALIGTCTQCRLFLQTI